MTSGQSIYIDADNSSYASDFKIRTPIKIQSVSPSASPSVRNLDIPAKELTTSMCQEKIKGLKNGYREINQKVTTLQEDGMVYFHQEFTEKVSKLKSS